MAPVLDKANPSDAFPVTNEVKQGCVLAPMQFGMLFSVKPAINIRFMTEGRLFNHRRPQAITKVNETVL